MIHLRNKFIRLIAFVAAINFPVLASAVHCMEGADPEAISVGKTVWIYPTWSDGSKEIFFAHSSTDLKTWEKHGPILSFSDIAWIKEDGRKHHGAWAPGITEKNGKFYFYFSVGPQDNEHPSRIGVAVSDKPEGPFKDSGKPLLTGGNGFEAIDAMVFNDPKSGKSYFYAGGSAGAKLRVFEMNPDMISFAKEISVETPKNFTEGAYMHLRNGIYYLSYSHGGYRDSSYSVHYATSNSPIGPWTYRGTILTSGSTQKGPGHHSFFKNPVDGSDMIAYHSWDKQNGDGPYGGQRQVHIDKIEYTDDGLIKTVPTE